MGSLCKTSTETVTPAAPTETVSGTTLPTWVSQGGQDLFQQAKYLAQQPFQAYDGPRVAGLNNLQQTGLDQAAQNFGAYRPYIDEAASMTRQGVQPWNAQTAETYMNPYNQLVTNRAVDEFNRDVSQRQIGLDQRAGQAQSFGGGRHAVLGAEMERNRQQQVGDIQLKGNQAGYDTAYNMYGQDQGRLLGGAGQLGTLGQVGQGMAQADVTNAFNTGSLQQAQDQRNLDVGYQDYLEQREYPYRQTNFALGALKGTPYETKTTGTSLAPQIVQTSSPLVQGAGALGALYSGYKLGQSF
jgi:hypothetical protein